LQVLGLHAASPDLTMSQDLKPLLSHLLSAVEEIAASQRRMESTLGIVQSDVAVLKSDVAVLKSDVAVLKGDVAVLKTDVAVLKSDVTALKTGQAVIAARLDEQRLTINALIPTRLAALPGRPDAAE
jgi:outer membrane murein-binding lipoprotein Lpp